MEFDLLQPIVSVRDVLPGLGFLPVWGGATDLDPAYEFKGGGIDLCVAQVTNTFFLPEFIICGIACNDRSMTEVGQPMPLTLESRSQAVAWLAYAVGVDFKPLEPVPWFEEGRELQHLLPWEERRAELRAEMQEYERLRVLRPHCMVEREGLRALLNISLRTIGWPPAPGHFKLSFDGELLKLRARHRIAVAQAEGTAWSHAYVGELRHLHGLPRRLDSDPVEVGIWRDMLEVGRVRLPVVTSDPSANSQGLGPICED